MTKRDPIEEVKKLLNENLSAHVHLDDAHGNIEIRKLSDGFTLKIFGFTSDGYLRAIELARMQEWRPMGNSTFKSGYDIFFTSLGKYIMDLQMEFGLSNILIDDDERF